jgi:hypothetical protein
VARRVDTGSPRRRARAALRNRNSQCLGGLHLVGPRSTRRGLYKSLPRSRFRVCFRLWLMSATGRSRQRAAAIRKTYGHRAKSRRSIELQVEEGARDGPKRNRKESTMCYEFSNWSWKLRAAELARKEREAANAAKKQDQLIGPPQPATSETPVEQHESVPA